MKTVMSLREIEDLGYSLTDTICVFCSATFAEKPAFCYTCQEYKGLANIVEAVGYYGKDVLPIQGKCQTPMLQF